ncbi:MAG TPA: hypothetical protein PKE45_23375 [Caldilineaceae bacterium]|nr:hypothetical protein [Caldilineaceae bacterium]
MRLSAEAAFFQFPTWSPNNRWLTMLGSTQHDAGVFLASAESGGAASLRQLYRSNRQPPIYNAWSPDSTLLSMLAVHPDSRLALYLIDALQEEHSEPSLVVSGQPCFWHWHADSRGLLVHIDLGQRSAHLANIRWRNARQPSIQPINIQPGYFQAPAISYDGRHLAYAQLSHSGESQLVVASREHKVVIGEHIGVTAMNWSPTATQLAFIHPLTATQHFYGPLHLWQAEDEQVRRLSARTVVAFFWAPDGKRIAFFTVAGDPAPTQPERVNGAINGHLKNSWPFMPTPALAALQLGVHILEIASGEERQVATFTPSQPFFNQFLPFFDQYAKSHSLWSPHSDALVLSAEVNGHPQIVAVDVERGQLQTIAEGQMASWSW